MRKKPFLKNEYYHIYNRGVDKRDIFLEEYDSQRFFKSLNYFNSIEPIGSIYKQSFGVGHDGEEELENDYPLVDIVAYCLLPNHYHLILKQVEDGGISNFMHRLGGGYTRYFNEKNERSGALFQGKFKSTHIENNEQLLYVSSYVNLNWKIHDIRSSQQKLVKSSWKEYQRDDVLDSDICRKDIIMSQYKKAADYTKEAVKIAGEIALRRREELEFD